MGKTLKNSQRTIAAVSVASMALLNVGIMAPAAHGAATDGPSVITGTEDPSPVSQVGMPRNVVLKITKRTPDDNTNATDDNDDYTNRGNGTALEQLPGDAAVEGVTFELFKIEGRLSGGTAINVGDDPAEEAPFYDDESGEAAPPKYTGDELKVKPADRIDLTKNDSWATASRISETFNELDASQRKAVIKAGQIWVPVYDDDSETYSYEFYKISATNVSGKTNNKGVLKFEVSGNDRGLYIVKENVGAEDEVKVHPKNDGPVKKKKGSELIQSQPFVVALPMTDQGITGQGDKAVSHTDKWLKIVNVYPKNSVTAIEKSVKDDQTPGTGNTEDGADSNIVYTIKTDIPENTTLEAYDLVDPLDSRLTYVSSALKILSADGDVPLDPYTEENTDGDYVITTKDGNGAVNPASKNDEDDDVDTVGTWYTVEFTEEGLRKLNENGGKKVQWELTANIKGTSGASSIENQAYLIPDNEGHNKWKKNNTPETPPGTPSKKVVSKYGTVKIHKLGTSNGEELSELNGATFKLYTCDENANFDADEDQVTVDNASEWTSKNLPNSRDDKGWIIIDGLQLNDFKNNSQGRTVEEAEQEAQKKNWKEDHFYCLVETKAPAGYELPPEPVTQFQLLASDTFEKAKWTKMIEIKNVANNGGFELPLTGGKGIFGLVALGALLVIGSIGYIFLAARRRQES